MSIELIKTLHSLEFNNKSPKQIFQEISKIDAKVCVTSSFQTNSIPMLKILSDLKLNIDIVFIDTHMHFKETLDFVSFVSKKLSLNVKIISSQRLSHIAYPNINVDQCCNERKIKPLKQFLSNYDIWITGIRRDQTIKRNQYDFISYDFKFNIIKICPMLEFSKEDIDRINKKQNLIHPLSSKGYESIGCSYCTEPSYEGERSGRWAGLLKTECGLHS